MMIMKAIFITYDQAHDEHVLDVLDKYSCRGYTRWSEVSGRGSATGDPHLGSHAWPSTNMALIAMTPDEKVAGVLAALRTLDRESPLLGLRAFVWNVEQSI